MKGHSIFVLVEQQRLIRQSRTLQGRLVRIQHQHLRNHTPAGLLGCGSGDLLPAFQLLFQAFLVRPGHAAFCRERHNLRRAQLRSLLDHVLQLIRLWKGHIHTDPDGCLGRRGSVIHKRQAKLLRILHFTQPLLSAAVTQEDLFPLLQAKHLGVSGVFTGKPGCLSGKLLRCYKKANHITASFLWVFYTIA